jgi:hypothetical protein
MNILTTRYVISFLIGCCLLSVKLNNKDIMFVFLTPRYFQGKEQLFSFYLDFRLVLMSFEAHKKS